MNKDSGYAVNQVCQLPNWHENTEHLGFVESMNKKIKLKNERIEHIKNAINDIKRVQRWGKNWYLSDYMKYLTDKLAKYQADSPGKEVDPIQGPDAEPSAEPNAEQDYSIYGQEDKDDLSDDSANAFARWHQAGYDGSHFENSQLDERDEIDDVIIVEPENEIIGVESNSHIKLDFKEVEPYVPNLKAKRRINPSKSVKNKKSKVESTEKS